ncbi:multimerin-2a isoform X2 [Eucyclogobius newberryi]|uniref:multimerin-2a isoform X2 n=1 Tax=Eucyclogobius newberryi TaxID=166745 RepID=UPI003B5CF4BB
MRQVLLLLGLLLSAQSELRARDPEEEQEQEDERLKATDPREGSIPKDNVQQGGVPQGNIPTRSGNWCAVVQKRVVNETVMSGTEQYTVKSQSPCPSGVPNCQLIMYKLSTRPLYKQTLREVTALLWQCCPGHTGPNCDNSVSGAQPDPAYSGHSALNGPGSEHMDPHQEQNDHQGMLYHTSQSQRPHNTPQDADGSSDHTYQPEASIQPMESGRQDNTQKTQHHLPPNTAHYSEHTYRAPAQHTWGSQDPNLLQIVGDRTDPAALRYQDTPAVLPVPHMMALVMSQLQPILEAFNRSLVHMQSRLGALTLEVAELKDLSSPELQASSLSRDGLGDDDKLEQVYQKLRETQNQMEQQRHLLESHHALLLSNLTRLRTDMNVNFQAVHLSVSELKMDQKHTSSELAPGSEASALWGAVERLDNRVVNNTVKVQTLLEDVEVVSGSVQQLHRLNKDHDKRINETSRRSQVQFMETGLEVEAAKVVVLQRVEELAGNMSVQGQRLTELDVDVDYLYTIFYKQNNSTGDCGCSDLRTSVAQLQKGLTNVTELAKDNRLALEESEEQGASWGDSDWQPAVEVLQQGLEQVKSSWALGENRTRGVERSVADLSWSLQQWQAKVTYLQQTEAQRTQDNQNLRGSFNSLLKDAIRHSDVLELLLGEEVLEFLDWPIHDRTAHSIPTLKERLRQHEEQLRVHNQSIARITKHSIDPKEVPAADQPSSHPRPLTDWLTEDDSGRRGPARERLSLEPDLRDGSDLWKLEQVVEMLQRRVESMEKQNSSRQRDSRLQDEVRWLKRGLEDHLRVFKNIFSNTDKLAASKQPLELDKVLELVKSRQRRKGGSGGTH